MGMETRDISILIQHLLAFSHHPNNAPSLQTTQLHFQQQQHQHHLTHQKNPHQKPSNANMQFTILAFAAMAAAIPAMIQERAPGSVCPALDTPLCCQADVDGVADVTCEARKYPALYLLKLTQTLIFHFSPASDSSSVQAFKNSCASSGTTAKCCVLPLVCPALTAKPFIRQNTCTDNNNPHRLVMLFSAAPHKHIMYGATGETSNQPTLVFMNEI